VAKKNESESAAGEREQTPSRPCGVAMPISGFEGYTAEHWSDVRSIIFEGLERANFKPRMISTSPDIGTIHKTIVQNVYTDEIVVFDVSGRNPNVMTELGMRLAFDKAVVIVKDETTPYTFDTQLIEHLPYPRDLNYRGIVAFQEQLGERSLATAKAAKQDKDFSPFLKHFGKFKVASLETVEASGTEVLLDEVRRLAQSLAYIEQSLFGTRSVITREPNRPTKDSVIESEAKEAIRTITNTISNWDTIPLEEKVSLVRSRLVNKLPIRTLPATEWIKRLINEVAFEDL